MDYFDPDYFDPDYFDTPTVVASAGHGASKSAFTDHPHVDLALPEPVVVDEGWITLIL